MGERLHGFDALRAVAALLVVMLHAAVAYTLVRLPGLAWPTHDPTPSPFVDGVFWWIEGFIMPLFFLIAGYFAASLYQSLGPKRFLRHRARRLLLPLLFGVVFVLPLDLYVWVFGWVAEGSVPLRKLRSLKFDGETGGNLWGLSHLWFLQYLYLYCVIACVVGWAVKKAQATPWGRNTARIASGSGIDWLFGSAWKPALFAVPGAIVLWFAPEVVTGFQHGFFPYPSKFLYTLPFFAVGLWMHGFCQRRDCLTEYSSFYLLASLPVFVAMLSLIHEHLAVELVGSRRLLLAGSISLFAWLSVLGLTGLFLRLFNRPHRALQYVSEASFWIYLVHHPFVGLAQVDLARAPIAAELKFVLVTTTVFAIALLTYQALVRGTWVGVLLNGRRRRLRLPNTEPVLEIDIKRPRDVAPAAVVSEGEKAA